MHVQAALYKIQRRSVSIEKFALFYWKELFKCYAFESYCIDESVTPNSSVLIRTRLAYVERLEFVKFLGSWTFIKF